MRLFLAIDLPGEIKDYLFEIEKKMREAKVTWVAKKNLHLTVKFLGNVSSVRLSLVKEKIKIKHPSLDVSLGTIGFFPNKKNPKVLWISIEPEQKVILFQQKIDEQLLSLFPNEQRFQAHITLGRIKSVRRREEFFQSIENIQIEPKRFTIASFQLVKSELKSTGPKYTTLENVTLSKM